jgi:hypothetical protein
VQELLRRIEYLNVVLLQLKLRKAHYRIFYDEDMDILFNGTKAPLEPIEAWIRERLGGFLKSNSPITQHSMSLDTPGK